MQQFVYLVTGATSGIGRATAHMLAKRGDTVVVVGRNSQKCIATAAAIKNKTGNQSVDYLVADLSLQKDIHTLVDRFQSKYTRLDVLINNVGTISWSKQLTHDGIELTFALNHLSYFLLTNLLLDVLISSGSSRIVNVSSVAHMRAAIDIDDIRNPTNYKAFKAYGESKLANLLFTYEMARRLKDTELTVNSLHPGVIATNLLGNGKVPLSWLTRPILRSMFALVGQNVNKGAEKVVYLSTSREISDVTGKYFVDGIEAYSSELSYDMNMAYHLWEFSSQLTGLPSGRSQI